jgi:hypothetical protein
MNIRVIPWVAWMYRITGWAYYNFEIFFNGHQPKIGAELFREAFEDYEYLYLANGGRYPRPYVNEVADPAARSIGFRYYTNFIDISIDFIQHDHLE